MKLNQNQNIEILIIGLGLLGGSYAKALKKKGYTVKAITRSQSSIDYALENGIIDDGAAEIRPEWIRQASLTVFGLYPTVLIDWVRQNGHLFPKGAVLTDVTGVKSGIVNEVQALLPAGVEFIASHPMAGREVYGVQNSDDSIFHGANYIVVPTEKNTEEGIALCKELGRELGFSRISVLTPEEHDDMIAFLSQLTHCIAVSLMCCNDNENLVAYTGDSFRDLTRIARINDEMWSELFLLNQKPLLLEMNRFRESFDELYTAIQNGDREKIRALMRLSTQRRAKFDKKG